MAGEKSINLLWNCAKELTTETHAERLLKSYYTNTCRKLAKHNIQLPDDCVGSARMCKRCGNQWADGYYELQLHPQRLANNAKRRRLIARLDVDKVKEKGTREKGKLSIGARKRAKWLKKRMASNIAVDCSLCGHNTMLPLEKPKKRCKAAETITTKTTPTQVASKKKKKKNKNQDVNAGLKLPAPPSQTQQQKAPTAQKTAPTRIATATTTTPAGQSNKQKKKPKSKAAQSKSTAAAVSSALKVQSKTQKQNALLQLAAQLKSHASKTASKSPQDRLQALLR
ncbi:hypothetical protein KR093_002967 [Drosophila rubida]|uniref:Uncharacterized protein n=1 Tax=Drosophila rubida TaxID=30044 RepID=A0AAD4JZ24_9MUSC|nr:hypothetical protein KR093_002967 [Drosophila rubida]